SGELLLLEIKTQAGRGGLVKCVGMESVDPTIDTLYRSLDLIGVVLNGIIGFIFLALFSATAGGMIRDMLISDGPAYAISDPLYLILACTGALIAALIDLKGRAWEIFIVHG